MGKWDRFKGQLSLSRSTKVTGKENNFRNALSVSNIIVSKKKKKKNFFLVMPTLFEELFICAVPIRNVNIMLAIITETFKLRVTIKNIVVAY